MLHTLRTCGGSRPTCPLAEKRREFIASQGPELSAPDNDTPLLWLSGDNDPEVLESWAGREFLAHQGWYQDADSHYATIEAYAVRLTRFPKLIFEAIRDNMGDGLRVDLSSFEEIDYSDCAEGYYQPDECRKECARSVIRSADSTAESMAEDEREYQHKWRIENDIAENKETLKSLRSEIRALTHELKQLCPLVSAHPAAASAVRDSLKRLLSDRSELMGTNARLASEL